MQVRHGKDLMKHQRMTTIDNSFLEVKDYRNDASQLFGNIRIPAALFAGSSAVAAFAMPLSQQESLRLGLVKRLYALLMMTALSSQVVAVIVSTLTVALLTTRQSQPTRSVSELLHSPEYELEWVTARLHFLTGVTCFILGVGLRAWVTIACPVIAKAALGAVLSGTVLCLAFIYQVEGHLHILPTKTVWALPLRFIQLLWERSRSMPLFAASMLLSSTTLLYTLGSLPHIVKYLVQNGK